MNDIAISIKNVSKYYKLYDSPKDRLKEALSLSSKKLHKKFYATNNLNLEIKKGEIIGIVGKNGSGKSTLLKLITGVLTPDEGSIKVNGKISALLELGSGFNPEFTGMQNIFFYGTILGFTKKEMDEKLDDIVAFADIGDFINQPLKTYSSGMKSRLGFAVAVHIDPEILILDEVLSVGDILFKRKCYAKMEEFFNGGKTIIYVSHDASSVNQLCSRAVFLMDGTIVMDSDAKTVTEFYEKYLFANKKKKEVLKYEMLKHTNSNNNLLVTNHVDTAKEVVDSEKKSSTGDQYLETFLSTPNFLNDDIISFKDVYIKNDHANKVNSLQLNHNYYLVFTAKCHKDLQNIYFGALFMTIKGVVLSGSTSNNHKIGDSIEVKKEDVFHVSTKFECSLLPDTYIVKIFANLGAENNWSVVNDAYIFKVQNNRWYQAGQVDLKQTMLVKKI